MHEAKEYLRSVHTKNSISTLFHKMQLAGSRRLHCLSSESQLDKQELMTFLKLESASQISGLFCYLGVDKSCLADKKPFLRSRHRA